jgi:hypothetical protein
MSDIHNGVNNQHQQAQVPLYTREDVAIILREFEKQGDEQREISYKGCCIHTTSKMNIHG